MKDPEDITGEDSAELNEADLEKLAGGATKGHNPPVINVPSH